MVTDSIIKLSQDLYNFMYDTDYYNFCDNGSSEKNFNEIYLHFFLMYSIVSGKINLPT